MADEEGTLTEQLEELFVALATEAVAHLVERQGDKRARLEWLEAEEERIWHAFSARNAKLEGEHHLCALCCSLVCAAVLPSLVATAANHPSRAPSPKLTQHASRTQAPTLGCAEVYDSGERRCFAAKCSS